MIQYQNHTWALGGEPRVLGQAGDGRGGGDYNKSGLIALPPSPTGHLARWASNTLSPGSYSLNPTLTKLPSVR